MKLRDILLVSDYDRTLTDQNGQIPKANLDAIATFQQQGGCFTVATGRSLSMIRPQLQHFQLNAPLIAFNGGAIYDLQAEKALQVHPIVNMQEIAHRLMVAFPNANVDCQTLNYHFLLRYSFPHQRYLENFGMKLATQYHLDAFPQDPVLKVSVYPQIQELDIRQFFQVSPDIVAHADEMESFLQQEAGLAVERSAPGVIEFQCAGALKGTALQLVADRCNRSFVACVGDSPNDISMLTAANRGFAPADCNPTVLSSGATIVAPSSQGAIADVISRLTHLCT